MDGCGLIERTTVGDLDAQCAVVDAADQLCELRGVAADEHSPGPHPAGRVLRSEDHGSDVEAAIDEDPEQRVGLLVAGAHEIEHHVEGAAVDLDR